MRTTVECVFCSDKFIQRSIGQVTCSDECTAGHKKRIGVMHAIARKPVTTKLPVKAPSVPEKHRRVRLRKAQLKQEILKLKNELHQARQKCKRLERNPHSTEPSFYTSRAWRELRYRVLKSQGRVCAFCRATEGQMHVDHIKPRSLFPHLELVEFNLQVLCADCNLGKSNKDQTDFRKSVDNAIDGYK